MRSVYPKNKSEVISNEMISIDTLLDTAKDAHKVIVNILQQTRGVVIHAASNAKNQQDRDNLQAVAKVWDVLGL